MKSERKVTSFRCSLVLTVFVKMAGGGLPPGGDSLLSPSPLPELLLGMCPYAVLGILPSDSSSSTSTSFFASVTVKAIATAYRKAALRAHPDKNKGREAEAAQEFVRIQAAFSFLSCEDTRSSYHGYLEKKERHEQLLAERRKSHTQADEKKRKLAEDLQRKEEAFLAKKTASWNSSYDRGGGGAGRGGNEEDRERLRRIRERNEKLLEEHREQCRTKSSVYDTLKQNKQQRESSEQGYGIGVHGATGAAPVFSRVDEEEEELDDLLKRSVYVQWHLDGTTPPPTAPSGVSSSSSSPPAAVATADGHGHPNLSQKTKGVDGPSPFSSSPVTPSLLSSLFTPLHALYIYGFTSSSGLVAFATRERAIQSALEFQRQQKALRKSGSSLSSSRKPHPKEGQDVKGFSERRESEESSAKTTDAKEEEEKTRQPIRYKVKLADQVENLKETLRLLKEDTEGGGIPSDGEALKTGPSFSSSSFPGGVKIHEDNVHRWRPFSSTARTTTTNADAMRFSSASTRALDPRLPQTSSAHPSSSSSQTVIRTTSLAEFEAATLRQLREAAAKKKALTRQAIPRQPSPDVVVLDGDG
ncbi:hypothetical protein CSUI_000304 [Cystoisospora suis]|uniref:J domain-containing protein n=1 Tax=Cystoisospora suis TaxID=483139 RepID=A0A2C6LGX2_9APIC|nr:hypothetical protein CSUI_000304 [Cystoisospora suis]